MEAQLVDYLRHRLQMMALPEELQTASLISIRREALQIMA